MTDESRSPRTDLANRVVTPDERKSGFPIFPAAWKGWRRWLWERLPLRVRSAWNPYDNWLRGYNDGMEAGLGRAERRHERGERIR